MNKTSSNIRGSFKSSGNSYLQQDERLSNRVHRTILHEASNEKPNKSRNTSRVKELTFVRDENPQQEQYLTSWQSYRDEIRKKIGQTAGTIFIEDQNDDRSSRTNNLQSSSFKKNEELNRQKAQNSTKSLKDQMINNRPQSQIEKMNDSNTVGGLSKSRIQGYGFDSSSIRQDANQTLLSNGGNNTTLIKGTDKNNSSHIENLFKKYLGSPKLKKDKVTSQSRERSQRKMNNGFNVAESYNSLEPKNLLQNIRESINFKNGQKPREIVHSPSAKILPTDFFNNTLSHNLTQNERDKSNIKEQLKEKFNNITMSSERTPQQQTAISSGHSNRQISETSQFTLHQHQKSQIINKSPFQGVQQAQQQQRPISSLEDKLMSLRSSISHDNTPVKKQSFQNTLQSNIGLKTMRDELQAHKTISTHRESTNQPSLFNQNKTDKNKSKFFSDENDYSTGKAQYTQGLSTTEASPFRQKSQNIIHQSNSTYTASHTHQNIQQKLDDLFPQSEIRNLDQCLKKIIQSKNCESILTQMPFGYIKDLQKLSQTINDIININQIDSSSNNIVNRSQQFDSKFNYQTQVTSSAASTNGFNQLGRSDIKNNSISRRIL
ncbi:UNKNOWN [Stylonychia lemnae]|uniref:Uncharacterized protein n=1 Tax=Stylonychia lemnae TaxID=5949 RepID=A0A077ZZV0_STYLE|nr:UNKNOWN [Stylonychia lemnae]|eukprot:CDW74733.1 UNKNOWN [Stylonychia lemnae]